MYFKTVINALFIFSLVLAQFSFIAGLPGWLASLNLILVVFVFILGLVNFKTALWLAIIAGFILDIFSFRPFGIYLISFPLVVITAELMLVNFFTNRSLYSFLALTFFSTIIYESLLFIIGRAAVLINGAEIISVPASSFFFLLAKESIINLLVVLFIFYAINFISNKFKPVFLIKQNS